MKGHPASVQWMSPDRVSISCIRHCGPHALAMESNSQEQSGSSAPGAACTAVDLDWDRGPAAAQLPDAFTPNPAGRYYVLMAHRPQSASHQSRYKLPLTLSPLPSLSPNNPHPLEGLWRGTYGRHGMEWVHMRVTSNDFASPCLEGTKITGDLHVVAGQQTIQVDLGRSLPVEGGRFQLPPGFQSDVNLDAPGVSLIPQSQYPALAQISEFLYESPRWIQAQCIVFSPTCIGLLWDTISAFSLFTKVPHDIGALATAAGIQL